jgi:hypothetical protein
LKRTTAQALSRKIHGVSTRECGVGITRNRDIVELKSELPNVAIDVKEGVIGRMRRSEPIDLEADPQDRQVIETFTDRVQNLKIGAIHVDSSIFIKSTLVIRFSARKDRRKMGLLGSANRVLPHALIWVNSRDESDFRFSAWYWIVAATASRPQGLRAQYDRPSVSLRLEERVVGLDSYETGNVSDVRIFLSGLQAIAFLEVWIKSVNRQICSKTRQTASISRLHPTSITDIYSPFNRGTTDSNNRAGLLSVCISRSFLSVKLSIGKRQTGVRKEPC